MNISVSRNHDPLQGVRSGVKVARKALLLGCLVLSLFAAAASSPQEAKALASIGGITCDELGNRYWVTLPRGTYGYGYYGVETDGRMTFYSAPLYWNGSYWRAYISGTWWIAPNEVLRAGAPNTWVRVFWYSYTYKTWFLMGGCQFPWSYGL